MSGRYVSISIYWGRLRDTLPTRILPIRLLKDAYTCRERAKSAGPLHGQFLRDATDVALARQELLGIGGRRRVP